MDHTDDCTGGPEMRARLRCLGSTSNDLRPRSDTGELDEAAPWCRIRERAMALQKDDEGSAEWPPGGYPAD